MTLLVFFLRGGGLVSSSLFAIKTGFTAQEPQFYRCATFGLNGLAGPCVRFPGEGWRNGVHVQARGFPVPAVLEGARCILSCATPPTPPAILAAASHPMTVVEHLAAGSLCEEANVIIPN